MKFDGLLQLIQNTSVVMQQGAVKAINRMLTIRNWMIGYYIVEYEQEGEDRAHYGEAVLETLANELNDTGLSYRNLRLFRQFYLSYPQIGKTVSDFLSKEFQIRQSPIAKLYNPDNEHNEIWQSLPAKLPDSKILSHMISGEKLLNSMSFTHFVQLLPIENPLKRTFYETECINGVWSVRELQRQINTMYYERSGMSRKPELLSEQVQQLAEQLSIREIIKSPFTFEFLGIKAKDVVYENDLEQALIENLQEFMLELGHGICFEARQKRIVIGDEYFFIDLVFYHRILKCHILIELKTKEVKHEHIGQLNVYLNYFKKEIMRPDDNPPVGILLVTEDNKALVEYATAGMNEKLFVSKYLVELPSKKQLEEFIMRELKKM
jgi:predicted nuclease of restriction endonuclease-like (RecB) superfamily